jgi:glycosyltransferase involved in cell wall biosynthesis
MLALLENPDLRNRLIKRGYDNVKRFSWEKTARETLAVYQRVFNMKKK